MKKIYKLILELPINNEPVRAGLPRGAKVIHVNQQYGNPAIWFMFDNDALYSGETDMRTFRVIATGQVCPERAKYLGTSHCNPFVWHIFEDET